MTYPIKQERLIMPDALKIEAQYIEATEEVLELLEIGRAVQYVLAEGLLIGMCGPYYEVGAIVHGEWACDARIGSLRGLPHLARAVLADERFAGKDEAERAGG